MSIKEKAAQALAERELAMDAYGAVESVAALEALRASLVGAEDEARAILDLTILHRKRAEKGELEELNAVADWFDKSALPVAAAFPVFLTFLASEKILADPMRSTALLVAYLFGGVLWVICRWKSLQYSKRAKRGAAELGKVD